MIVELYFTSRIITQLMKMRDVGLKRKRSSFRVSSNYLGQALCGEMNSRQGAGSTGLGLLAMGLGVQTESRWSSEHKTGGCLLGFLCLWVREVVDKSKLLIPVRCKFLYGVSVHIARGITTVSSVSGDGAVRSVPIF